MTQTQARSLKRALEREFKGKAEFELINGRGRYRFAVTSTRFATMTHLERQDEVWKVVDQSLPRQATMDVSMILAFAPADLATAHK